MQEHEPDPGDFTPSTQLLNATLRVFNYECFSWMQTIPEMLRYARVSHQTAEALSNHINWKRIANLLFMGDIPTEKDTDLLKQGCRRWSSAVRNSSFRGCYTSRRTEYAGIAMDIDEDYSSDEESMRKRVKSFRFRPFWDALVSTKVGPCEPGVCCCVKPRFYPIITQLFPDLYTEKLTNFLSQFRLVFHKYSSKVTGALRFGEGSSQFLVDLGQGEGIWFCIHWTSYRNISGQARDYNVKLLYDDDWSAIWKSGYILESSLGLTKRIRRCLDRILESADAMGTPNGHKKMTCVILLWWASTAGIETEYFIEPMINSIASWSRIHLVY